MTKNDFIKLYLISIEKGYNYIGVSVRVKDNPEPEYIINGKGNFENKLAYYQKAYDENMRLIANPDIYIDHIITGNTLELS